MYVRNNYLRNDNWNAIASYDVEVQVLDIDLTYLSDITCAITYCLIMNEYNRSSFHHLVHIVNIAQ
jgi:hypothetical protein